MSKQNKERERLQKLYHQFYDKHVYDRCPEIGGDCYYCGEYASTEDHCPPLTHIENKKIADWKKDGYDLITVRCCSECNNALGSKSLYIIEERLAFLENKYSKELERVITLWSDEELEEMSAEMRRSIVAKRTRTNDLAARIRNIQWRLRQVADEFPTNT